jgi:cysteinyl-tRNA synthetase
MHAGAAGDRPTGVVEGAAGHGTAAGAGADTPLADRAHGPAAPLSAEGRALHERFVAAIDEDLDLPGAIAIVREILRAPLSDDEKRWLVLDTDLVLGLDLDRAWEVPAGVDVPAEIQARVEERDAARAAHDYARSDSLRDDLAALGWDVVDGTDGSTVRRREAVR